MTKLTERGERLAWRSMVNGERETDPSEVAAPQSPLGGTRAQSLQRLQVGVSLLIGIILIVGLASVIEQRATQSEATAVAQKSTPDSAAAQTSANDPLADAGVVPDLPAEATPAASPTPQISGGT